VWYEKSPTEIFLFPGIRLSKNFPFKFGENFYRDSDRYGQSLLVLKFPLRNTKLTRKKDNMRILEYAEGFTTILLWLRSNSLKIVEGEGEVCDIPDYNNVLGHYYLISARKGTVIRARDGEQEMELVF